MKTTLYLVRHGATAYNLENPPRLQGRGVNIALSPIGVRQAELTRDFLARGHIDVCYSSPLERALQTAAILAAPHQLIPEVAEGLTECDVGEWEGLSWREIAERFPAAYGRYMENPARHGYLGGESFADVGERATRAIEDILTRHAGQTVLVVAHHVVNRTYLAGVMGLGPELARRVSLDNCSISIVEKGKVETVVRTLNCSFHLVGVAA